MRGPTVIDVLTSGCSLDRSHCNTQYVMSVFKLVYPIWEVRYDKSHYSTL